MKQRLEELDLEETVRPVQARKSGRKTKMMMMMSTNYRIGPQLPHRTQYHHKNFAGDHIELIPCYLRNIEANEQLVS